MTATFSVTTTVVVLLLLLCGLLCKSGVAQTPPQECFDFPAVNSTTDCFIEVGGSAGNCSFATPCGSFQQAIDAGCTHVAVQPGTYSGVENRNLAAGNLANIQANGAVGSVVVDLEGLGRFITFSAAPPATSVTVVNMTILNGFLETVSDFSGGGAIMIIAREFTIVNSMFTNNTVLGLGSNVTLTRGGAFVAIQGGLREATVCGCTFDSNNVTAIAGPARGAGFHVANYELVSWGNAFRNGTALSPIMGSGGGIYFNGGTFNMANAQIENCRFCNNTNSHDSAGLYLIRSPMSIVSDNIFLENTVLASTFSLNGGNNNVSAVFDFVGGAIRDATSEGGVTYRDNIYRSNAVLGPNTGGGAVALESGFNSSTSGGERFCNNTAGNATAIFTSNNIAYDFSDSSFQCNGAEADAIEPGNCTNGCVFLPDADCSLCGIPGFSCEAILVLPQVHSISHVHTFSTFLYYFHLAFMTSNWSSSWNGACLLLFILLCQAYLTYSWFRHLVRWRGIAAGDRV